MFTDRPKVVIRHLVEPVYYETALNGIEGKVPRGILASCATNICTALRGKLVLLLEKCDQFFLVTTDVEAGVPPIVREHTARFSAIIGTRLDHDEAAREMFPAGHPYLGSGLYFYE